MKSTLLILTIITLFHTSQAQISAPDTTAYLKSIEAQKSYFIGKPFSVLMDSLKIKIKSFTGSPNPTNISKEPATSFYFKRPKYLEDFSEKYLRIEWALELDGVRAEKIFDSTAEPGTWTADAKDFYKTAIIKDIKAK